MTGDGGPRETELKYAVADGEALGRWLDDGGLGPTGYASGAWRELELEDRYLDTPDERLRAAGYAARLRRVADEVIVSVKGRGEGDGTPRLGLHRRAEIEGPANDSLDPAGWPDGEARELVERVVAGAPLRERFCIRQHRRERPLLAADGTPVALLSLQDAALYDAGRELGRQQALEIELRGDSEEPLETIARAVEASGLVEPERRSKEDWAEELLRTAAGRDDVARTEPARTGATVRERGKGPGVTGDDPFGEAGRKVLRHNLAAMLSREAGVRAGGDAEEIHKMRVATRRMRAAWRVFGEAYEPRRVRGYTKELRSVARRLGAVRDLDVLIGGASDHAEGLSDAEREALRPLLDDWERRRDEARASLLGALDSDGYRRFVDDYQEFVSSPGLGLVAVQAGSPQRVKEMAGSRIWAAYEQLRAYDAMVRWADETTLHELRISGKRFRYTLEFFQEPLGPEARPLIERVTELQDELGALNDASVAGGLGRDFLRASLATLGSASVDGIGRYVATQDRRIRGNRRSVVPIWRRLMQPAFRASLGRVISGL